LHVNEYFIYEESVLDAVTREAFQEQEKYFVHEFHAKAGTQLMAVHVSRTCTQMFSCFVEDSNDAFLIAQVTALAEKNEVSGN